MCSRVTRLPQRLLLIFSTNKREISTQKRKKKSNVGEIYDAQIYFAGSSRDFPKVRQLLDRRVKDGVKFDINNTFLFITRNTRDFSDVVDELYRSLLRLQIGVSKKISFDSFIARLCIIGRIDESLRVLNRVLNFCDCADSITFHPVLHVFTRRKSMAKAWSMVELMKDYGIKPDVTVYNYLLTAYCRSGAVVEASEVVGRMVEEGVEMDERTYDAIVIGVWSSGGVEGGVRLLRKVVEDDITSTRATFVHLLDAMFRRGEIRFGFELVKRFGGEKLDSAVFGVLARRMLLLGRIEDAEFLLREMKKRRKDKEKLDIRSTYFSNM